jgi:primase-polymerase (primpol)-like protein
MQEYIPGKLATLKGQLQQLEERKAKYKSVHGTWIKLDTLNKELESMKSMVDTYEAEKVEAVNKADVVSTKQMHTILVSLTVGNQRLLQSWLR